MGNKYREGDFKNIFKSLDNNSSLWLLGLCLASNDIVLCQEQMNNCRDEEKTYFFATSLSILREIAKLIYTAENIGVEKYFSNETNIVFSSLKQEPKSIKTGSLTKDVLKPIRDNTFHYNFLDDKKNIEKLFPFLEDLRRESELQIRANIEDTSITRHRYVFADIFRHNFNKSLLNKELIGKLPTVEVNVIFFVDSLLADLSNSE